MANRPNSRLVTWHLISYVDSAPVSHGSWLAVANRPSRGRSAMWNSRKRALVRWRSVIIVFSVAVVQLAAVQTAASAASTPASGSTVIGPGCPVWNATHDDWDTHATWSS